MTLLEKSMFIWHLLKHKRYTIVTKAQTSLGLEGEGIKNIISPHDGGYILIKWS